MQLISTILLAIILAVVVIINIYPIIGLIIIYWYVALAIVALIICAIICKHVNPRFYYKSVEELNVQLPLRLWHVFMIILIVVLYCSLRNKSDLIDARTNAYQSGYEEGYSNGYSNGFDDGYYDEEYMRFDDTVPEN